ncbi:MAG: hypothetical protein R3B45_17075 [Bdellovibrionota bacterium]
MSNHLFDYNPSDEDVLIDRLLTQIHKAVDKNLPGAAQAPRRYSKTLFSDEESTAFVKAAIEHEESLQIHESSLIPPIPQASKQNESISELTPGDKLFADSPTSSLNIEDKTDEKGTSADDTPPIEPVHSTEEGDFMEKEYDDVEESSQEPSQGFSGAFEYTEPKAVTGGRDFLLVTVAFLALICLAAAYWYFSD